jgi:hypothetical protein
MMVEQDGFYEAECEPHPEPSPDIPEWPDTYKPWMH